MSRRSPASLRWVLDTNVVLSALIRPGGTVGRLRLAWQAGLFVPLVSSHAAAELVRVLAYPKLGLGPGEREDLLADYLPWAEAVQIANVPSSTPACRDPHDLPFLHLAIAAKADAIVSGDGDLLCLVGQLTMPVLTPAEAVGCLERLRKTD